MTYIIEAQLKDGSYMEHVKNPLVSNLPLACIRARELSKLPGVIISDVCTTTGIIVEKFSKGKQLSLTY
jgi:hypothetical protein